MDKSYHMCYMIHYCYTIALYQRMPMNRNVVEKISFQEVKDQLEMFHQIFDSIFNGAMVTDAHGIITHMNRPYERFLGLNAGEGIGKHCTEVVENTRMHIVAQTGRAEINHIQKICGQKILVHRIPIRKGGKVVAVFGLVMFQDLTEVVKLGKKLRHLESQVARYKKELMALDGVVDKAEVRLPEGALRELGEYEIAIQVHGDVFAAVAIAVVPE